MQYMKILKYSEIHRESCLDIFQSNLDKYFADSELKEFEKYLDSIAISESYFVVLKENEVVACGGYERSGKTVGLCWGMVHRNFHGHSIGTFLLEKRLETIAEKYGHCEVMIDTSQHTQGFYEKSGFSVKQTVKNGYAEGLDTVYMIYRASKS